MNAPAPTQPSAPLDRLVGHASAWALMAAGGALLALAVLTPEAFATQQLSHRLATIRLTADQSHEAVVRHQNMLDQLNARDPALLTHLARIQLRMRPAEAMPLLETTPDPAALVSSPSELTTYTTDHAASLAVENWLNPQLPPAGTQIPRFEPPQSRPARWATTWPGRGLITLTGFGLLLLGVLAPWLMPPILEPRMHTN